MSEHKHNGLEAIDFEKVLEQFASHASTRQAAQQILQAQPLEDIHQAREQLVLAKEALAFENAGRSVSLQPFDDVVSLIGRAKKNLVLTPPELLQISYFLASCRALSQAFDAAVTPNLADIASTISVPAGLEKAINKAVDLSGRIKPDATSHLKSLHRQLEKARGDVSQAARRFVKANESSLMDSIVTSIQGRTCVLVKAAEKNRFGGMIHGSSQSGQAFYTEPQVLVELNNEAFALQAQIEEEEAAICQQLSAQVSSGAGRMLSSEESLVILDIALAKGRWCAYHDGCIPVLQPRSRGFLASHAVHPLLDKNQAVANTYSLEPGVDCLMISGANMGGKTVTLKTMGLFAALSASGFPVSAHEARIPWFDGLYFDIGDSQSIEQNLSTFSGHARALGNILSRAKEDSLVILDEIGSGTDPAQGSSLAQAVLETLLQRGSMTLTSTHYGDVKAWGKTREGVLVSSVQFDMDTLRPTYKYLSGISGASFAYDIAAACGMDKEVLDLARHFEEKNETELARQLKSLETQQAKVQADREKFEALVADAHRLQKEAQEKREKAVEMRRKLDENYEKQLEDMLFEKKEEAKSILRDLRNSTKRADHELIEKMRGLDSLGSSQNGQSEKPESETKEFYPGDYVHISSLNNHGEVLSVRKKKAQVLVNGRKITVNTADLTSMKKPQQPKKPVRQSRGLSLKSFPYELNLIGMRVEEGIDALDHYLDQAVFHNMKNVRIIHGMGTGALRSAVWKDLSVHPAVKTYSAAGPSEGGLGATLVELK